VAGEGSAPLVSVLELLTALREGRVDELKSRLSSSDYVYFRAYALPRPHIRVRAASKRLVELDSGKMARLEYSLFYASLEAAKQGGNPTFKRIAELVGDYKAAAGYIALMWRLGLVTLPDREKAITLYMAYNSLSQKGYERRIARVLDLPVLLNVEALAKLEHDDLLCVYLDGRLGCKYIVSKTTRDQAKAQLRAFNDALK
jgi:hypothetical protein